MPITMTLPINNIRQRTGRRTREYNHQFDGNDGWKLTNVRSARFGLLIYWDNALKIGTTAAGRDEKIELDFLEVRAWHGPNRQKEFGLGSQQQLQKIYGEIGGDPLSPETFNNQRVLSAALNRDDEVFLEFEVNTDHPTYCKAAERTIAQGKTALKIELTTYAFDADIDDDGKITLTIGPGSRVGAYEGYVAIDFGNTTSTLAALPVGSRRVSAIRILAPHATDQAKLPELKPQAPAVESVLRIDYVAKQPESQPRVAPHPDLVGWVTGEWARIGRSSNGVIYGSKRMMTGPGWEDTVDVMVAEAREPGEGANLRRQPYPIPGRIPAELFLCRTFQQFRQAQQEYPSRLAVTYPTTYSAREMRQLREVVSRAWLRTMVQKQDGDKIGEAEKHIELELDEASAAAFFFLYRRIFEKPGGLPRFRYLYPDGMNLLLYDGGGGTTDVVLVRGRLDPANPNVLKVVVLARSGVRDFGGDNITIEVFRLLKAKIAAALAKSRGESKALDALPQDPTKWAAYLDANADKFDKWVPTRFDADNWVGGADQQRNRDHTWTLWMCAEDLKKVLGTPAAPGKPPPSEAALPSSIAGKLGEFLTKSAGKDGLKFEQIKVSRAEIDALIRPRVLHSIELCNRLIQQRLWLAKGDPQEVHWVVAAGNATRYPLFEELFAKHLYVPFFADRFLHDTENCKHAVAKGAVLALGWDKEARSVGIDFDSNLADQLPFTIGVFNQQHDAVRVLYPEGSRYSKMTSPLYIEVVTGKGEKPAEYLILERRWPDEEKFNKFLTFRFKDGIASPVKVSYDPDTAQFVAQDHNDADGELVEGDREKAYRPPPQRGDL